MQISGLKSENLMVESQNGRVELNDIVTEKVEVKSANGKLDLNNVEENWLGHRIMVKSHWSRKTWIG